MVSPDDLVSEAWTGEGELSHDHKYLDRGHHTTLTWRHLLGSKTNLRTRRRIPGHQRFLLAARLVGANGLAVLQLGAGMGRLDR